MHNAILPTQWSAEPFYCNMNCSCAESAKKLCHSADSAKNVCHSADSAKNALAPRQDEAFALWKTHWGTIYPENSQSRAIIERISDTYYLVNLVDNDFVGGSCLFQVLYDVLECIGKPRGP